MLRRELRTAIVILCLLLPAANLANGEEDEARTRRLRLLYAQRSYLPYHYAAARRNSFSGLYIGDAKNYTDTLIPIDLRLDLTPTLAVQVKFSEHRQDNLRAATADVDALLRSRPYFVAPETFFLVSQTRKAAIGVRWLPLHWDLIDFGLNATVEYRRQAFYSPFSYSYSVLEEKSRMFGMGALALIRLGPLAGFSLEAGAGALYLRGPWTYHSALSSTGGEFQWISSQPGASARYFALPWYVELNYLIDPGLTLIASYRKTDAWFQVRHFGLLAIPAEETIARNVYDVRSVEPWLADSSRELALGVEVSF